MPCRSLDPCPGGGEVEGSGLRGVFRPTPSGGVEVSGLGGGLQAHTGWSPDPHPGWSPGDNWGVSQADTPPTATESTNSVELV